jgi:hypothetical protein
MLWTRQLTATDRILVINTELSLDQGKAIVADAGSNMILSGYFNSSVSLGGPTLTNLNGGDSTSSN